MVSYTHRSSKGFEMSANYTWSHAISDAPDANSFEQSAVIENPFSRAYDRGNTLVNRPQAFNMSAVLVAHVQARQRRDEAVGRTTTS